MKSTPTYTKGRRRAEAHLLRPADDKSRKLGGLLAVAKVTMLASLRAATIAYSTSALEKITAGRLPARVRMRLPYPSIPVVAP
jgi:hypothetical protein